VHCMLVVVFENENKADEGKTVLLKLDHEGIIGILGYAVVAKNADDTALAEQQDVYGTFSPFGRTLLETLSSAIGTAVGPAQQDNDLAADSMNTKTRQNFINDVREVLLPHRVAIVVEVEEEWPPVVDSRMESIGGIVFRWNVSEVQHASGT
jgi:uncharacterized membrane protein